MNALMAEDDIDVIGAALELGDSHVEAIRKVASPRALAPGEVLLREGQPAGALHLVVGGRLSVVVEDGTEIGECEPGDIVGEIAMFDGGVVTATVTATEPTRLWSLDRAGIDKLYTSAPRAATAFMQAVCTALATRLRAASDRLEERVDASTRKALLQALLLGKSST
jgi:CRP-like cAMP-binding protein